MEASHLYGMAPRRAVSSGRANIASASIVESSDFVTTESNEYSPAGAVADKSISGIGLSAAASSNNAATISYRSDTDGTL